MPKRQQRYSAPDHVGQAGERHAHEREQHLRDQEERIRGLIREMHEAAKDARAAARELDERMKRWGGSATTYYRRVIAEHDKTLRSEIQQHVAKIHQITEDSARQYREHTAAIFGASSSDELLLVLTTDIARRIGPIVEAAATRAVNVKTFRKIVIDEIANSLASQLESDIDSEDEKTRKMAISLLRAIDPALSRLTSLDIKTFVIEDSTTSELYNSK